MPRLIAVRFAAIAFAAAVLNIVPAAAASDRDHLADESIGLMIENSGNGQAEALLGILYLRGMRVESDPIAATAWLERAAAAGHPAGIYAAARMYAEGIGVAPDTDRARRLLRDADPATFGTLADAVRQLRLSLDLPDVPVMSAAASPAPDTGGLAPSTTAPSGEALVPPARAPVAAPVAEPPVEPSPPSGAAAPSEPEPLAVAEPASPAVAGPGAAGTTEPAATEPAGTEPVPPASAAEPPPPAARPTEPSAAGSIVANAPAISPAPGPGLAATPAVYAQLATLFAENSAAAELNRVRALLPAALLEGHDLVVRSVRLGDGRLAFRVLAIGFDDREGVRAFCSQVAPTGIGCIPRG